MRIGFIEDTCLRGGTQLWVMRAMRHFSQECQVTLLAPTDSPVVKYAQELGFECFGYDFDMMHVDSQAYEEVWKNALDQMDVAICTVHPHRGAFHCSEFAAKVIKQYQLATVLMPKTGTIVPSYKKSFYLDETLGQQNHIICITDFTRKYLMDQYHIPAAKISLLYQGVDVNKFTMMEKKASDTLSLLCMGTLEYRKGQKFLIQIVKKLHDMYPNIRLTLVGEGPDQEEILEQIKDDDIITLRPFTSTPEKEITACDILVLPSLEKEGLPNVILEAMACGKTVVASRLAGIPEVIIDGHNGYLCEPGDDVGREDTLVRILSHRDKQDIGSDAQHTIVKHFNEHLQFEKFLELFEQLVV